MCIHLVTSIINVIITESHTITITCAQRMCMPLLYEWCDCGQYMRPLLDTPSLPAYTQCPQSLSISLGTIIAHGRLMQLRAQARIYSAVLPPLSFLCMYLHVAYTVGSTNMVSVICIEYQHVISGLTFSHTMVLESYHQEDGFSSCVIR